MFFSATRSNVDGHCGTGRIVALVVGRDAIATTELQRQLHGHGVHCPERSALLLDEAVETLRNVERRPHVVFVKSTGELSWDVPAIKWLCKATTAEVVAVCDQLPSRQLLRLIRAGAADCLNDIQHLNEDLRELFTRLGRRERSSESLGTIISVVSASGGCGASTVAVNLAANIVGRGWECNLVDMKPHGGDLASMLDLQPQHTLVDLCQQATELDQEMLDKSLLTHRTGIKLLAGPGPQETQLGIAPDDIRQVLTLAAQKFSYVVLDLEDIYHPEQQAALMSSVKLLVVLRLEFPCLVRARRLLEHLELQGFPADRIELVVNRFVHRGELRPAQVVEAIGKPVNVYLPEDYGLAALAANVGNPLVAESPGSKLAAAYKHLSDCVIGS